MGRTFCLYNERKKERYELGKGQWSKLFGNGQFKFRKKFNTEHDFYCWMLYHVSPYFNPEVTLEYFHILAKEILTWCGQDTIKLYEDQSFTDKYNPDCALTRKEMNEEYPYTGDRHMQSDEFQINESTSSNKITYRVFVPPDQLFQVVGTHLSISETENLIYNDKEIVATISKESAVINVKFQQGV